MLKTTVKELEDWRFQTKVPNSPVLIRYYPGMNVCTLQDVFWNDLGCLQKWEKKQM